MSVVLGPSAAERGFDSPSKVDRLGVCTVNWAWCERVTVYSGQLMITPSSTKTYAAQLGPGPQAPFGKIGLRYFVPASPPHAGTDA